MILVSQKIIQKGSDKMNKEIINKLNELYVLYRKKFLILDHSGYKTVQTTKEKKIRLTDTHLKYHLNQNKTIGVFSGSIFSKFICFDVDITHTQQAKMTVYILVNALQQMGIPYENIYTSISGSKGYHVEIFFDKPVQNTLIKQFYLMVLNYSELLNISYGKVELRPTDSQGVKIPLGKHFETDEICWYCDYEKSLKPIKNYEYILSIKQLESEYFYNLMNRSDDNYQLTEKDAENYENIIIKHKPLKIYSENVDENVTIEAIEKLIENGLPMTGTRHNSLIKIAKYNKYFGMNIADNKEFLIEWLLQQNKYLYTTKWEDCLKDIEDIVNWVYENNCSLVIKNMDILITAEEIMSILHVDGKNEKVVLYSLLIHKKRYANKDGIFYMSYKQMQESTGLSERTVIRVIKRLELNNIISVTRNSVIKYNKGLKKPTSEVNIYNYLLSDKKYNTFNSNKFSVCDKNCHNCFCTCLFRLLSKSEIKTILPRKQYQSFLKSINDYPCVI